MHSRRWAWCSPSRSGFLLLSATSVQHHSLTDSSPSTDIHIATQALALAGRIVIMTIHQPRSSIFSEFDRLTVLTEGRLVYFGKRNALDGYLDRLGYRCSAGFNVADYLLDLISLDHRDEVKEVTSRERIEALCSRFREVSCRERAAFFELEGHDGEEKKDADESEHGSTAGSERSQHSQASFHSSTAAEGSLPTKPAGCEAHLRVCIRYIRLVGVLYWRATVENLRDLNTQMVKLFVLLFLAAIISLLYSKSDPVYSSTQASIQDRIGLLFFVVINQSFGPVLEVVKVFPQEKLICGKEISSGAYPSSAYFLSRFFSSLPFGIFNAIIYSTIIYFSVGLSVDAVKYFIFLGAVGMTQVCAQSFGLLLSAYAPNANVAQAVWVYILAVLSPPPCLVYLIVL